MIHITQDAKEALESIEIKEGAKKSEVYADIVMAGIQALNNPETIELIEEREDVVPAMVGTTPNLYITRRQGPRETWAKGWEAVIFANDVVEAQSYLKFLPEEFHVNVNELQDQTPGILGIVNIPEKS